MGCHVDPALYMALFVSDISYDPDLSDAAVRDAIDDTLGRLGVDGCYAEAAQVFGDRPEVAVVRMRWVRDVVARAVAQPPDQRAAVLAEVVPRPPTASTASQPAARHGTGSPPAFPRVVRLGSPDRDGGRHVDTSAGRAPASHGC